MGTNESWDLEVRPSQRVALGRGERIIRTDVVFLQHTATFGPWPNVTKHDDGFVPIHRCAMYLTSSRVVFAPLRVSWFETMSAFFYLVPLLNVLLLYARRAPPLLKSISFDLGSIDRLWCGKSTFAGPPVMDVGPESWTFRLMENRRPWTKYASKSAVHEHFEAVEAAWAAARTRTTVTRADRHTQR